jgi:hypothetical protein
MSYPPAAMACSRAWARLEFVWLFAAALATGLAGQLTAGAKEPLHAETKVPFKVTGPDGLPFNAESLVGTNYSDNGVPKNPYVDAPDPHNPGPYYLTPKGIKDLERSKYPDAGYNLVDPNSEPTDQQDCGGYVFQKLWPQIDPQTGQPIPYRLGSQQFYDRLIRDTDAQEVSTQDAEKGDVVVFFTGPDQAGHVAIVVDVTSDPPPINLNPYDDPPKNVIIESKDNNERPYVGVLNGGATDPFLNYDSYGIKIYHIDPNDVRVT